DYIKTIIVSQDEHNTSHITEPVAFKEILPLPIIVTQDEHNKNVYYAESKWYG
ncbi:15947_t:CDS:1, partial [Racocetra fulgida]